MIEPLREIEAIEKVLQPSVRVRHHHQSQAAVFERGQRRCDVGLDVLPQVIETVILAQLGQRRIGARVLGDAGVLQDKIEIQPAAGAIVGLADRVRIVDVVGARKAGLREGILFDMAGLYEGVDCPRVTSLASLVEWIDKPSGNQMRKRVP